MTLMQIADKILCGGPPVACNESLEAEVTVVAVLDWLYSHFALVCYILPES